MTITLNHSAKYISNGTTINVIVREILPSGMVRVGTQLPTLFGFRTESTFVLPVERLFR